MLQNVVIRKVIEADIEFLYDMLQDTINITYKDIYPTEAVKLFKDRYSRDHIIEFADNGYSVIAEYKGKIIGTGNLSNNHINQVYINPFFQNKGVGEMIVGKLEEKAKYDKIVTIDLEASINSRIFWESLGYTVRKEDFVPLENNKELRYFTMSKNVI